MTTTAAPPVITPTEHECGRSRRLFTVDELYAMDKAGIFDSDERIELLDGEIIVMPPIGPPHADGTTRLGSSMTHLLYNRAIVRVQQSVRLDDQSLPEPDIAILKMRDDYHLEHPSPEDVLLLIEVADTSLEFDREVKLERYAAAGIPEVWIVNLRARQVEGHSDPVGGTYRSQRVVTANGRIGPLAFPDVALAVADFLLE